MCNPYVGADQWPALARPTSCVAPDERHGTDRHLRQRCLARLRPAGGHGGRRRRDDRGEGVISAAIAVLVMAGLGALMWVGFRAIWEDTEANTRDRIAEIGQ